MLFVGEETALLAFARASCVPSSQQRYRPDGTDGMEPELAELVTRNGLIGTAPV